LEPKRLKTVARETPAAIATSSIVAVWNEPSVISRSAASSTRSTLSAPGRRRAAV
jgi:hypothetical protein